MADVVYYVSAFPVCVFPVFYAMGSAVCYARCGKLRRCVAEEDDTAVWFWLTMCCAALQAALGALAVLLPYRRWRIRRALAYLAVAVLLVGRCMYASVMSLDANDPGSGLVYTLSLVGKILCASGIFGLAVADLLSFLALHVHGSAHEE